VQLKLAVIGEFSCDLGNVAIGKPENET